VNAAQPDAAAFWVVGAFEWVFFLKKTPKLADSQRVVPILICIFCKNLAAHVFTKKGQLFGHSSPLFSSDVPHRTQKDGSTDQKLPAFLIENRWLSFYYFF
jgi:hypothetical protein